MKTTGHTSPCINQGPLNWKGILLDGGIPHCDLAGIMESNWFWMEPSVGQRILRFHCWKFFIYKDINIYCGLQSRSAFKDCHCRITLLIFVEQVKIYRQSPSSFLLRTVSTLSAYEWVEERPVSSWSRCKHRLFRFCITSRLREQRTEM